MKQHFCPAEQSMIAFEKECNWCGELESQEPDYWLGYGLQAHTEKPFDNATALYTHPPQRTWVGLTDEEIDYIYTGIEAVHDEVDSDVLCRAIEAKLKEKNT